MEELWTYHFYSTIHDLVREQIVAKVMILALSIPLWEMLTSALRVLIKNPVKESFYGKKKKKTINILTAFFHFP